MRSLTRIFTALLPASLQTCVLWQIGCVVLLELSLDDLALAAVLLTG